MTETVPTPQIDVEVEKFTILAQCRTLEETIDTMAGAIQALLIAQGLTFYYDTWDPDARIGEYGRFSILSAIDVITSGQRFHWYNNKSVAVSRVAIEAYTTALEAKNHTTGIINQERTSEIHHMNQEALLSAQSRLLRVMNVLHERLEKPYEPRVVTRTL